MRQRAHARVAAGWREVWPAVDTPPSIVFLIKKEKRDVPSGGFLTQFTYLKEPNSNKRIKIWWHGLSGQMVQLARNSSRLRDGLNMSEQDCLVWKAQRLETQEDKVSSTKLFIEAPRSKAALSLNINKLKEHTLLLYRKTYGIDSKSSLKCNKSDTDWGGR